MAIILLPICFILLFLGIGVSTITTKREAFIYTVLGFCLLVLAGTEALSAIHCLSIIPLAAYWLLVIIITSSYLYKNRYKTKAFTASLKEQIVSYVKGLNLFEKLLIVTLTGLLAIIFIQGVGYPPTNWDSMTYHMARITSWVGHRSVAYYPTDITRQIYQPPFAEYIIAHFNLLARSDYFSASVQWLFLVFSLITVNGIASVMGLNRKARLFAMIVAATIPEAVLQASSTQNDLVEGFFTLASFYFMLKSLIDGERKYFLWLGVAAGFSLLTKGTGYIYLFPLLLVFGIVVLIRLIKGRKYSLFTNSIVAVFILIIINSAYYIRNYRLAHNLLGIDKTEAKVYSNENMSAPLLASGILKNAALHMEMMFSKKVEIMADSGVIKLHKAVGLNVNDPAVNYRSMKFELNGNVTNEDNAPNPFHFLLIGVAIIIFIIYCKRINNNRPALWLLIIVLLQIILFCAYLKWQPWNSRLHTPVFLLSVLLIAYAFNLTDKLFKLSYVIAPLLLVYALLVAIHNDTRPTNRRMIKQTRFEKYFMGKPMAMNEYSEVYGLIHQNNFKNIGLMLGVDDWEYPLFKDCYSETLIPTYIEVTNITRAADTAIYPVDCIVSTRVNAPYIDYNNKRYYNQDKDNKMVHLYK